MAYVSSWLGHMFTRLDGPAAGEDVDLIIEFDGEFYDNGDYHNEFSVVGVTFDLPKFIVQDDEIIADLGGPLTVNELAMIERWFEENIHLAEEKVNYEFDDELDKEYDRDD